MYKKPVLHFQVGILLGIFFFKTTEKVQKFEMPINI